MAVKSVISRTFIAVKPDGVERGLVGEILRRFEQRGLRIVGLKLVKPSREHIDAHYPKDEAWIRRLGEKTIATAEEYDLDLGHREKDVLELGHEIRGWLFDYLANHPVVAAVIEGPHAVEVVRKIVGGSKPYEAAVGTIRGDFGADTPAMANFERRPVKNLIHASETEAEAEHEIGHWFNNNELLN